MMLKDSLRTLPSLTRSETPSGKCGPRFTMLFRWSSVTLASVFITDTRPFTASKLISLGNGGRLVKGEPSLPGDPLWRAGVVGSVCVGSEWVRWCGFDLVSIPLSSGLPFKPNTTHRMPAFRWTKSSSGDGTSAWAAGGTQLS